MNIVLEALCLKYVVQFDGRVHSFGSTVRVFFELLAALCESSSSYPLDAPANATPWASSSLQCELRLCVLSSATTWAERPSDGSRRLMCANQ